MNADDKQDAGERIKQFLETHDIERASVTLNDECNEIYLNLFSASIENILDTFREAYGVPTAKWFEREGRFMYTFKYEHGTILVMPYRRKTPLYEKADASVTFIKA